MLRWPQSYVALFEKVLPQHLLDAVLEAADELSNSPNFWMPKQGFAGTQTPKLPAEAVIQALYQNVMCKMLPDSIAGAEYWVQVYRPGKGLAFHFDKDEDLFKESQEMKHPVLSSVLYLSGDKRQPRLGPTVIVDQQFDNVEGEAIPRHPERSALVWPQLNSLCVFDGRLGHGVLDSAAHETRRVTMLINWWTYQPQSSAAIFKSWDHMQAVHCPPSPQPQLLEHQHREPEGSSKAQQGLHPASEEPDPTKDTPSRASVAVVKVPHVEEPQTFTIDDLMESFGLSIQGDTAISALAIEHTGFQLYPIGEEQEEQLEILKTAGALVSSELLESEASDSSE